MNFNETRELNMLEVSLGFALIVGLAIWLI